MRIDTLDALLSSLTLPIFLEILESKNGVLLVDVIKANSWRDLGFDDLDEVEFIMGIEEKINSQINDEIVFKFYSSYSPKLIYTLLISQQRDDKINQILP